MTPFLGEYECRADTKMRITLPAALKGQMPSEANGQFVLNRGFEKCLVLYPITEWRTITEQIQKLNQYVKRNRDFIRYFFRGASELTLDKSSRLLLPKRLADYAGIDKDVVLFAHTNKVEVWAKEIYDDLLSDEPDDFADLAETVMGDALGSAEDEPNIPSA